jgi:hypothetical protein
MLVYAIWKGLLSEAARQRQIRAHREQKRVFHEDLKRLLALGYHLIDDIGLDPHAVHSWVQRESVHAGSPEAESRTLTDCASSALRLSSPSSLNVRTKGGLHV